MIPSVGAFLGRDFLDVADLEAAQLRDLLELAHAIQAGRWAERPLEDGNLRSGAGGSWITLSTLAADAG